MCSRSVGGDEFMRAYAHVDCASGRKDFSCPSCENLNQTSESDTCGAGQAGSSNDLPKKNQPRLCRQNHEKTILADIRCQTLLWWSECTDTHWNQCLLLLSAPQSCICSRRKYKHVPIQPFLSNDIGHARTQFSAKLCVGPKTLGEVLVLELDLPHGTI